MHTYYLAKEFSCISREGPNVYGVGRTSTVSCLGSETLVSCGIIGIKFIGGVKALEAEDGSYFCQALSNMDKEAVRRMNMSYFALLQSKVSNTYIAVAQCCDFPKDAEAHKFIVRSNDDEQTATAECPSNSVLTGCDVYYESGLRGTYDEDGELYSEALRGSFTGDQDAPPQTSSWISTDNKCTAGAKDGTYVSATAHCLETFNDYSLECETKAQKTNHAGYEGCEPGYEIMSCNTWHTHNKKGLDGYAVRADKEGKCWVQMDNHDKQYANAVCCRIRKRLLCYTICTLLHMVQI